MKKDSSKEPQTENLTPEVSEVSQTTWKKTHSPNAVWAIILISLGLIFLLNNFGLLPWNIWGNIWRLWPMFLIIWGLQVIFGRSYWGNLLTALLGIFIVVLILGLSLDNVNQNFSNWAKTNIPGWRQARSFFTPSQERTRKELKVSATDYPEVKSRNLKAKVGGAKFILNDSEGTELLKVDSNYFSNYGEPKLTVKKTDSTLDLDFKTEDRFVFMGMMGSPSYEFNLGQPSLPTELDIDLGAGRGEITLTKLMLSRITVDQGAGEMDIDLSEASLPTKASMIKLGAGTITLNLPSSVGLKINYQVGVGNLRVDGKNLKGDSSYKSDNYDSAAKKVEFDIEIGAGSITINY